MATAEAMDVGTYAQLQQIQRARLARAKQRPASAPVKPTPRPLRPVNNDGAAGGAEIAASTHAAASGWVASSTADSWRRELLSALLHELHVVRARVQHVLELFGRLKESLFERVDDAARVRGALLAGAAGGDRLCVTLQAGELTVERSDVLLDDVRQLVDLHRRVFEERLRLRQLRQLAQLAGRRVDVRTDAGGARGKLGFFAEVWPWPGQLLPLRAPARDHLLELQRAIHAHLFRRVRSNSAA